MAKRPLQEMEEHKYRYLKDFLNRTQKALESCIQIIRFHEGKLCGYYEETIKHSSDDFVKIILVDSAFILELLFKFHFRGEASRGRLSKRKLLDIRSDMILLENQVPFFILEALFDPDRVDYGKHKKLSLIQLYRSLFRNGLNTIGVEYTRYSLTSCQVEGEHFVDIARNLCLPPEPLVGGTLKPAFNFAPSITELRQSGVKLQVGTRRNLYGLKIENGILEIPRIIISDESVRILRNITAFEQCHFREQNIGTYIHLLDSFVDNLNDVELLTNHRIVTNSFSDNNEACSMIHNLSKPLYVSAIDFWFATLFEDLFQHCEKPWNKWKANLRQSYLNTS